jgi:hypothetical protein
MASKIASKYKVITVETFNETGFNALYRSHFGNILWIFIALQLLSIKILYNSFALTNVWAMHVVFTLAILQSCVSVARFLGRISERTIKFSQIDDVIPAIGELVSLLILLACNNFIRDEQRAPREITLFYNCSIAIHAAVRAIQIAVTTFHDYQKNKRQ